MIVTFIPMSSVIVASPQFYFRMTLDTLLYFCHQLQVHTFDNDNLGPIYSRWKASEIAEDQEEGQYEVLDTKVS